MAIGKVKKLKPIIKIAFITECTMCQSVAFSKSECKTEKEFLKDLKQLGWKGILTESVIHSCCPKCVGFYR